MSNFRFWAIVVCLVLIVIVLSRVLYLLGKIFWIWWQENHPVLQKKVERKVPDLSRLPARENEVPAPTGSSVLNYECPVPGPQRMFSLFVDEDQVGVATVQQMILWLCLEYPGSIIGLECDYHWLSRYIQMIESSGCTGAAKKSDGLFTVLCVSQQVRTENQIGVGYRFPARWISSEPINPVDFQETEKSECKATANETVVESSHDGQTIADDPFFLNQDLKEEDEKGGTKVEEFAPPPPVEAEKPPYVPKGLTGIVRLNGRREPEAKVQLPEHPAE